MSLSKSSIRTPSSWCVSSFMSTNLRNSLLFSWFTISITLPSCDLDKIVDASFCETNWKIGMLHFLLFIWNLPYLSLFSWTSASVSANPPVPWRNSQTNETTEDTSVIKRMIRYWRKGVIYRRIKARILCSLSSFRYNPIMTTWRLFSLMKY